jgi:hypothetical protein
MIRGIVPVGLVLLDGCTHSYQHRISRADGVLCNLDARRRWLCLAVEQSLREGRAIPS